MPSFSNGSWPLHRSRGAILNYVLRNIPMPYYALSNLLTLFSHDMPTLALIQHTFDYLLVRTPVACIYIAAAVGPFCSTYPTSHLHLQMILSRKEEVTWLGAVGEEGMLHSILSGLPILYEEGEEGDPQLPEEATQETKAEGTKPDALPNGDRVSESPVKSEEPSVAGPATDDSSLAVPLPCGGEEVVVQPLPTKPLSMSPGGIDAVWNLSTPSSNLSSVETDETGLDRESLGEKSPTFTENDTTLVDGSIIKGESEDAKPAPTPTSTPPSEPEPGTSDPWPDAPGQPAKARMSLSALLRQADDLLARFPPSHPRLDLGTIMGPRSTMITWTESFSSLPPDDELEQYVKTPHLVVLPYVDPVEEAMIKRKEEGDSGMRKVERKLRKGIFARANVQKRVVFAGAVLALGIAMAVYGIRGPGDAGRGHHRGDWKKLLRFVGGLVLASGDKFFGRLLGH